MTDTVNVKIEHIAKLTNSNDTVEITKAEGDVIIDTSVNKGSDKLVFGSGYDKSKFTTKVDGQDLKLVYDADGSSSQTITIKNYFSKDGNSTKSSVKGIEINGETKNILDLYTNVVSAKGTKINGSMFNDVITGTDKADKISTGAGNDTITAGKGNDTINITGAGNKTIKINDLDGNDVITGIAKADKVNLEFNSVDETVDYSKSGNNLVATREFYTDLQGNATTMAESKGSKATGTFYSKDGDIITEAAYNELASDAKTDYTKVTDEVYSYGSGENLIYSTDATKDNDLVKEITTIKDYFKNDKNIDKIDGITSVAVSGKGKIVGGFTDDVITGSAKNDKMYGMGGNNTYIFNTDGETSFGSDTVYATGTKDTLTFAENSKLTYTLKGNDVIVSVADSDNKELGKVTIKDALKSEQNVYVQIGNGISKKLEDVIKSNLTFDKSKATKGQTLNGTIFDDTFVGSDYADKISTGAGDDIITAGKGNDTINITGAGEKTINIVNGDGNDVITGIAKADKVTLSGLTAEKLSYAKSGNDLIITRIENEADTGEGGTIKKPAETATTTIKDYFKDSKNAGKLEGVTVDKVAVTGKGKIVGTFDNDVITGSAKADKIYTGAGNDTITAGKGNDTIYINGAGNKTINIANGDGNDVITGASTEGSSTNIVFDTDSIKYSKGANNSDLIITRSYKEQLTNKKGNLLYVDEVTGDYTTNKEHTLQEATGTFYIKDNDIITEADFTAIGKKAQEGYEEIVTKTYKKGNADAISEEAFGKLQEEEKNDYTVIITKTYKKGDADAISEEDYNKLATDAQNASRYEATTDKVYSYTKDGDTIYTTSSSLVNAKAEKDCSATTTVKDFFNPDKTSDVSVNGEKLDDKKLNGLTISGQNIMGTNYDDVIYGSTKNDVILEQAGNNTFNIGTRGSTIISSAGESSNDIYNVENLNTDVDIYDNGGDDILNINDKNMKTEELRYVFDVDKKGAKGDLIITNAKGITSSKFNGVAINDYFTTQVTVPDTSNEEEGATKVETVDHKIENINLNGSSINSDVATSIANITNDVQNFLNANNYDSASDVFNGKNKKAKAELKEIYNSGNNKYNFSTVEGNAEQKVTDKIGDNDIYNVDDKFDFAKDKLVISDSQGENDVLNIAQKADDLTILFDIKKTTAEGESAVGDALYVVGKGSTDLSKGIQMSGIDKVKTADGDVTALTNADKIVADVQGWLTSANKGIGYDSVADAIQANDSDLAGLIAKFAPSQPQA